MRVPGLFTFSRGGYFLLETYPAARASLPAVKQISGVTFAYSRRSGS